MNVNHLSFLIHPDIVELNCSEGVLGAWTQEKLYLIVRPSSSAQYTCTLKYQLIGRTSNKGM